MSMFFFSLLLEEVPQSDFWCRNFILESYYAFLFGKKWCVTLNLKFTVKSMTFMRTLLALAGFFRFLLKMWTILKVFIEFVTIFLLFYVLVLWPQGMWDLSSPTRN